jgi:hypothetical protein
MSIRTRVWIAVLVLYVVVTLAVMSAGELVFAASLIGLAILLLILPWIALIYARYWILTNPRD